MKLEISTFDYSHENIGFGILSVIFENDFVAIDMRELILSEWRNCCCGDEDEFFSQWVADRMIEDKIRKVGYSVNRICKKNLINNYGVPAKDLTYLLFAIGIAAHMIVSEDIDLYDPRAKQWDGKKKAEVIRSGSGGVFRYMKKKHAVTICCIKQVAAYLDA